MGRRFKTILASILTATLCANAQYVYPDSTMHKPSGFSRFAHSSIGAATFAGVPLIALGQVAKSDDSDFRHSLNGFLDEPEHSHDYYLQLTPAAIMLGMKAFGVQGESTWSQMLVADAAALVIMSGTVEALKHVTTEYRPDGSDEHSFPSGHTATAFMTATMLHHEYGSQYPWLSVTGYGLATTTAFLRIHDNRHWLGDVMTGAGIGIISTELGYVLSDLIFHKPILKDADYFNSLDYISNQSFVSYYVAYEHPFKGKGYYGGNGLNLKVSTGATIGAEGAWFINPYVGIGARASYSDYRMFANDVPQKQSLRYMSAMGGVYLSCPMTNRWSVGLKFQGGYGHYDAFDVDGPETPKYRYDTTGGFAFSYGTWVSMRASKGLSYRIYIDNNSMPKQHTDADRLKTVSIGAQAAVNF